jgi:hypothetical protein
MDETDEEPPQGTCAKMRDDATAKANPTQNSAE